MAPSLKDKILVDVLTLIVVSGIATIFVLVCWILSLYITWIGVLVLLAGLYWPIFGESTHSLDDKQNQKDVFVIIVGAGYAGLCAAIKLKQAKIRYLVLEKSSNLGGTWWDNQYPGCACDIMSHLYSYSFFPNPFWTTSFPSQPEILKYLEKVGDHYDLRKNIQFNTRVDTCKFNEDTQTWKVTTTTGECFSCNFLVSGIGVLHVPKKPNLPGINTFQGEAFHTAQWNKSYDFCNKAVGVIGTGASAVQVVPSILNVVKSIHVFQRTGVWVIPRANFKYPSFIQTIFHAFPILMRLHRWYIFIRQELLFVIIFSKHSILNKIARWWTTTVMQYQASNPELIPNFDPGCKRISISNDYVSCFNSPKVTLVTKAIKAITTKGVIVKDGEKEIDMDAIIYATGFDILASSLNVKVLGNGGEDLAEYWGDTPNAYLGITSPKFPNYFILLGPNVTVGHNSVVWMIECQVDYIIDTIVKATNEGIKSLEVKEDVNTKYQDYIKNLLKFRVFHSGCKSWYQNSEGFVYTLWPSHLLHYWWMTRSSNLSDFIKRF